MIILSRGTDRPRNIHVAPRGGAAPPPRNRATHLEGAATFRFPPRRRLLLSAVKMAMQIRRKRWESSWPLGPAMTRAWTTFHLSSTCKGK